MANKKNINIAVVDDDKLVVQLIADFLQQQNDFTVVLTANSGNSFLKQLENRDVKPDVVLLDLRMTDGNGLETIERLREQYSWLKIIVLSSHYKASSTGYMLKLGVDAFIPKGTETEDLIQVRRLLV